MKTIEEDQERAKVAITKAADRDEPVITIGRINVKPFLRLYYWYTNAPRDRQGGPWWYRDFVETEKLNEYLNDQRSFLHAYGFTSGDEAVSLDTIRPPKETWLWKKAEGRWRVVTTGERAELYCD